MPTEKVKQADFTFAISDPDLTDLASIQEALTKAAKSQSFAHLIERMNVEATHHTAPATPMPLARGVDLTFSGTAGSTGGKPSGSGTVAVTIHF